MNKTTFLEKISDALDAEDELDADQAVDDIPEWDSLGILAIVDCLEEMDIDADIKKLDKIKTVKELMELAGIDADD